MIDLKPTVETDVLRITVVNRSEQDLRLWARKNSWGWSMFSLLLARPDSDQWRELTAKPVRWTRNVPRAISISAEGHLDYELRYEDPNWDGLDDVYTLLGQPVQFQVRLRIPKTPEAVAQGVFIGEVTSSSSLSMPPHTWLTGRVG